MPLIEIQRVPGMPKERHSIGEGENLQYWLESKPLHSDVRITLNGSEIGDDDEIDITLSGHDHVVIYDQPKGGDLIKTLLNPFEHFNPIKFTQKVFSALRGGANSASYPGQAKTSPNTSLKQQTNIARNGEARPDSYGQVRAFPDLIQESSFEYINNIKKVTEWMDFGIGSYDITSVRYSESNLGSFAGASYAIYQPGQTIPLITEVFSFDDIDGQELPGPNESGNFPVQTATTTNVTSGEFSGGQARVTIPKNSAFDYFYDLAKPHSVSFIINLTYNTVSGSVTRNVTIYADLYNTTTTTSGTPAVQYYNFFFTNLGGSDLTGVPPDAVVNTTIFTLNDNQTLVIGPSFAPVAGEQIWVHLNAQLGTGDYARTTVTWWKIDDNNNQIPGTFQQDNVGLNNDGENSDNKYGTFKFTPSGGYGRYAVQLVRTNNSNATSILNVEAIQMVRQRTNVVYPNDTLVTVTVTATERATSQRERKYNALITRKTISYNQSTGSIDYTLRASRSFADAIMHSWIVIAGLPLAQIDAQSLYQISGSLPDSRLGYFDYTFDDEDVSIGERIQTICDSARVVCFWDDGVLSFVRDEARPYPSTVFNTRNMTADQYAITYDMTLPGGFDGVELQYRDPVTNKQAFVRYRVSGNSVIAGRGNKQKKISMMFIRNLYQATDRAILECRRLIYQRLSMNITAMADAEWLNIGEMIQVVDMFDSNQQSGEIRGRQGNVFYTSEAINFTPNMFVVITDRQGNVTQRYAALPVDGNRKAFQASIPEIDLALWDGKNVQSPSRYAIATDEELNKTLWVISSKNPGNGGKNTLSVSEYSDEMYNYTNPAS